MLIKIKERFKECFSVLKEELFELKEVTESQRKKVKEMYGYEIKGVMLYSDYNIVAFNKEDASFFVNIMPNQALFFSMSLSEYDVHMYCLRYNQDAVLSSIF